MSHAPRDDQSSANRSSSSYDRRTFLLGASAVLLGACTDTESDEETVVDAAPASTALEPADGAVDGGQDAGPEAAGLESLTPAMFEALPICALTPSAGAGPFPSRQLLDRRVIHEEYPGHPLRLGIRVVDADCQPVPGAVVDIWHTDATGDYSDFEDGGDGKDEGPGTTFCRGAQTADERGILEFETIYPGWYPARAIHIHAAVQVGGDDVLTTQLYFDEAYTETVLAEGEYAQFGPPLRTWSNDPVLGDTDPATDGTAIALTPGMTGIGEGTVGLINLGIDQA